MTTRSAKWTRRQFTQTLAASAAASLLPSTTFASPKPADNGFAFIGSAQNAILVFQVSGSQWTLLQTHPAVSPAHLILHPTLPILYAVHDVALWDNLPRGAVTAYSISTTGHLTLHNTQPLSLSATNPRHAALAADGTSMAIAAPAAGIFNILPLDLDGTLQPPAIIRKDLSPNIAETHSIHFLPNSKSLLTADSHHRPLHSFSIDGDFLIPTPIDPEQTLPTSPTSGTSALMPPIIHSPISLLFRPA